MQKTSGNSIHCIQSISKTKNYALYTRTDHLKLQRKLPLR